MVTPAREFLRSWGFLFLRFSVIMGFPFSSLAINCDGVAGCISDEGLDWIIYIQAVGRDDIFDDVLKGLPRFLLENWET